MMVDPEKRILQAARDARASKSDDVAETHVSVLLNTVLGDFVTELAELVAGRLVLNGCSRATASDAAQLIKQHARRFNVG